MGHPRFADSDAIFDYLLGFVNVERGQATVFKLDRMQALAEALGSPERSYRVVHVAGSKGKGSVSAMIASILEASGRRTGLYTSPHLLRWKERISLAGREIPDGTLAAAMERLLPLVEGKRAEDFPGGELPTYFELSTLLAFEAFRAEGCEWAVIETGLGGRLDSTNIVDSDLSVITPLELEHTEWLGDTIEKIAFEKAGIIKPGRPVCVAAEPPAARRVIGEVAAAKGSPLIDVAAFLRVSEPAIDVEGTRADFEFAAGGAWKGSRPFRTPMIGEIQAANMAQAIVAATLAERDIGPEAIGAGLASARLPARFEVLSRDPPLVVDGAHTPASVAHSLAAFERLFPGPKLLLFACALDKKHGEMAALLAPRFAGITVTRPGSFKQSDPGAVHASFAALAGGARLIPDPVEAFRAARERSLAEGLPLLVTGSFYLCAEVVKAFSPGRPGA